MGSWFYHKDIGAGKCSSGVLPLVYSGGLPATSGWHHPQPPPNPPSQPSWDPAPQPAGWHQPWDSLDSTANYVRTWPSPQAASAGRRTWQSTRWGPAPTYQYNHRQPCHNKRAHSAHTVAPLDHTAPVIRGECTAGPHRTTPT